MNANSTLIILLLSRNFGSYETIRCAYHNNNYITKEAHHDD